MANLPDDMKSEDVLKDVSRVDDKAVQWFLRICFEKNKMKDLDIIKSRIENQESMDMLKEMASDDLIAILNTIGSIDNTKDVITELMKQLCVLNKLMPEIRFGLEQETTKEIMDTEYIKQDNVIDDLIKLFKEEKTTKDSYAFGLFYNDHKRVYYIKMICDLASRLNTQKFKEVVNLFQSPKDFALLLDKVYIDMRDHKDKRDTVIEKIFDTNTHNNGTIKNILEPIMSELKEINKEAINNILSILMEEHSEKIAKSLVDFDDQLVKDIDNKILASMLNVMTKSQLPLCDVGLMNDVILKLEKCDVWWSIWNTNDFNFNTIDYIVRHMEYKLYKVEQIVTTGYFPFDIKKTEDKKDRLVKIINKIEYVGKDQDRVITKSIVEMITKAIINYYKTMKLDDAENKKDQRIFKLLGDLLYILGSVDVNKASIIANEIKKIEPDMSKMLDRLLKVKESEVSPDICAKNNGIKYLLQLLLVDNDLKETLQKDENLIIKIIIKVGRLMNYLDNKDDKWFDKHVWDFIRKPEHFAALLFGIHECTSINYDLKTDYYTYVKKCIKAKMILNSNNIDRIDKFIKRNIKNIDINLIECLKDLHTDQVQKKNDNIIEIDTDEDEDEYQDENQDEYQDEYDTLLVNFLNDNFDVGSLEYTINKLDQEKKKSFLIYMQKNDKNDSSKGIKAKVWRVCKVDNISDGLQIMDDDQTEMMMEWLGEGKNEIDILINIDKNCKNSDQIKKYVEKVLNKIKKDRMRNLLNDLFDKNGKIKDNNKDDINKLIKVFKKNSIGYDKILDMLLGVKQIDWENTLKLIGYNNGYDCAAGILMSITNTNNGFNDIINKIGYKSDLIKDMLSSCESLINLNNLFNMIQNAVGETAMKDNILEKFAISENILTNMNNPVNIDPELHNKIKLAIDGDLTEKKLTQEWETREKRRKDATYNNIDEDKPIVSSEKKLMIAMIVISIVMMATELVIVGISVTNEWMDGHGIDDEVVVNKMAMAMITVIVMLSVIGYLNSGKRSVLYDVVIIGGSVIMAIARVCMVASMRVKEYMSVMNIGMIGISLMMGIASLVVLIVSKKKKVKWNKKKDGSRIAKNVVVMLSASVMAITGWMVQNMDIYMPEEVNMEMNGEEMNGMLQ
ncbi:hypothetical protein OCOL_000724 [Ordospora colligata]